MKLSLEVKELVGIQETPRVKEIDVGIVGAIKDVAG